MIWTYFKSHEWATFTCTITSFGGNLHVCHSNAYYYLSLSGECNILWALTTSICFHILISTSMAHDLYLRSLISNTSLPLFSSSEKQPASTSCLSCPVMNLVICIICEPNCFNYAFSTLNTCSPSFQNLGARFKLYVTVSTFTSTVFPILLLHFRVKVLFARSIKRRMYTSRTPAW